MKPDADRARHTPEFEELTRLCLLYSDRRLTRADTTVSHVQKYREWIHDQLRSTESSTFGHETDEAIMKGITDLTQELPNLTRSRSLTILVHYWDVLGANSIIDIPEEGFGLDATGAVTRLGPDVKDLCVGDRVILFSRGSFSTSIITSEKFCEVIPDELKFEDAIYSLIDIGGLKRGQVQSVLIHSAFGAEIYVTVGSEVKANYL
ncbi:hypothetical protein N0V84_007538 [Fusarium piperis]|uniref:Enoyl reductase (ER) domain-containing protein n=1 Tax=Fusarium piperis TaxID=1435070 RepID=A0A9W9BM61_9HYPO|nr:hypothetical protein N0V84_007538 [Fusarium piperis]